MLRAAIACLLAACGAPAGTSPTVTPIRPAPLLPLRTFGTEHPYHIVSMPPDGRWSIVCQARADTNHDGKIEIYYEMHGEQAGDELIAYLIDPSGNETTIDTYLATDPQGRWLAVVEHGVPVLIETSTWTRTPLTGTLPQFRVTTGMAHWSFDRDGKHLLFIRDGAAMLRELATGREVVVAPHAWRAYFSTDTSWIVIDELVGDTNGDGFAVGPDLSPSEGIPGHNCGFKFDWVPAFQAMVPDGSDNALAERALHVLEAEASDKLRRTLHRVDDGLVVPGDQAIDHDTIITRDPHDRFAVSKVGDPPRLLPAGCEIQATYPPAHSVMLGCTLDEHHFSARWWQFGNSIERYRGDSKPFIYDRQDPIIQLRASGEVWFVDMRDGTIIDHGKHLHLVWADERRLVVDSEHSPAELRWLDHSHAPVSLATDAESLGPAGRYLVHGTLRVDIETGAVVQLGVQPVEVRTDGAVLVDGGYTLPDHDFGTPHKGPLRWVRPN